MQQALAAPPTYLTSPHLVAAAAASARSQLAGGPRPEQIEQLKGRARQGKALQEGRRFKGSRQGKVR